MLTTAPRALVGAVLARSSNTRSSFHGPGHWRRVASNGLALLEETPGADSYLVFLFALFHDSMRLNDHRDPRHGARAAVLAREILRGSYRVDDARMGLLEHALIEHDNGKTSADATLGVCWDADRLDLWRVGVRPSPVLLSTAAARDPAMIERGRVLQGEPAPPWAALEARYRTI